MIIPYAPGCEKEAIDNVDGSLDDLKYTEQVRPSNVLCVYNKALEEVLCGIKGIPTGQPEIREPVHAGGSFERLNCLVHLVHCCSVRLLDVLFCLRCLTSLGSPVNIKSRQYNLVPPLYPIQASRIIMHAQDVAAISLSKSQKKRLKKRADAEKKKEEAEENEDNGTQPCVSSLVLENQSVVPSSSWEHN